MDKSKSEYLLSILEWVPMKSKSGWEEVELTKQRTLFSHIADDTKDMWLIDMIDSLIKYPKSSDYSGSLCFIAAHTVSSNKETPMRLVVYSSLHQSIVGYYLNKRVTWVRETQRSISTIDKKYLLSSVELVKKDLDDIKY